MKLKDMSIKQLEKRMSLAGLKLAKARQKMSEAGVEMSELGIILNVKREQENKK